MYRMRLLSFLFLFALIGCPTAPDPDGLAEFDAEAPDEAATDYTVFPKPYDGPIYTEVHEGLYLTAALRSDMSAEFWSRSFKTIWLSKDDYLEGEKFIQISAGEVHACGIHLDGTVECWGGNDFNQLDSPVGQFTQVDATPLHTCGLRDDGQIICWGGHNRYNSCYGCDPPPGEYIQISAAYGVGCGLQTDGEIVCWGNGRYGHFDVPEGPFLQVSTAEYYACAIRRDTKAVCWGDNSSSHISGILSGVLDISSAMSTFTQIEAGKKYACGLATNGQVICWGGRRYATPTQPLGDQTFTQISTYINTCGIAPNGRMMCWGPDYASD